MQALVDHLDPAALDRTREQLESSGHARLKGLPDEALAALTFIGEHPPDLREAALPLVPTASLEAFHAYRLATCRDASGYAWDLTDLGNEMADLLAAQSPQPEGEELAAAKQRATELIERAKKELARPRNDDR